MISHGVRKILSRDKSVRNTDSVRRGVFRRALCVTGIENDAHWWLFSLHAEKGDVRRSFVVLCGSSEKKRGVRKFLSLGLLTGYGFPDLFFECELKFEFFSWFTKTFVCGL